MPESWHIGGKMCFARFASTVRLKNGHLLRTYSNAAIRSTYGARHDSHRAPQEGDLISLG